MARIARSGSLAALALGAATACGQAPPSYDFDFATIGVPGNAAYPGGPGPFPPMAGRGSVGYEYRISKMETTTAQWLEFVNTYSVLGGSWTTFAQPVFWGAVIDPTYSGPGRRYVLNPGIPDADRLPVASITWRDAAQYCNWLHNDKAPTLAAIQNGAYDASTFGNTGPLGTFTDQRQHHPDAKFWIPMFDEWMKAAHYDPNRFGPGQEGWWDYSYRSDTPPVPGLPGAGQTSAGLELGAFQEWAIPVGAYPSMASPWGLMDTSGAATEWTEEITDPVHPLWRGIKGSAAGSAQFGVDPEAAWGWADAFPWSSGHFSGLRVASSVPSPGTGLVLTVMIVPFLRRRRRRGS